MQDGCEHDLADHPTGVVIITLVLPKIVLGLIKSCEKIVTSRDVTISDSPAGSNASVQIDKRERETDPGDKALHVTRWREHICRQA